MQQKPRMLYIDNLKSLVIILAVLMHAAVTYSGMGSWYYKELPEQGLISMLCFFVFQTFSQAYFMGLMFLIAGYFASVSYERKGCTKFIKDRIIRLGAPTLLYMLAINPFMYYLIDWHNIRTQALFIEFYLNYMLSLRFLGGTGPLWFALALLIFSIVYALIRGRNRGLQPADKPFSFAIVVKLILLLTTSTFVIRFVEPLDTSVFNMQLCYFAQYIILFSFGIHAQKNKWLSKIEYRFGGKCILTAIVPGILFLLSIVYLGGALEGNSDAFKGGFHWQSLAFNFWESVTGVCMSVGLIAWFRQNFNWQNNLLKKISDSAFAVYVFQAPILVLVAQTMQMLILPPILKFLLLSALALPISFLVAKFVKIIPLFRTITKF
jgi:fucose 4-O-acetylase-like acetyltransferase